MPLDKSLLETGIVAAFAVGEVPPPGHGQMDVIMGLIATAYNAYAILAQSCAALTPTQVKFADLKDLLKASGAKYEKADWSVPAGEWADAFETYWTGGKFGGTGSVTTIGGTSALKAALTGIFSGAASSLGAIPSAVVAQQMAAALDVFTKTVMVKDTAVPSPSGCGPAPIS